MIKNAKPKDLAAHVMDKLKHSRSTLPTPPLRVLEELFECVFFASMKTEESDLVKVTVTLIDPDDPDPKPPRVPMAERWSVVRFDKPIVCSIRNLVKLAKAADPSATSLAVHYNAAGELLLWGMIDQAIHYQSFLNYESESGSEQPGVFQVSVSDIGTLDVLFDYELLATLKQNILIPRYVDVFTIGPISKILKANAGHLKVELKAFLAERHPEEDFEEWETFVDGLWIQTLSRLLLRIRDYHHGGGILITDETRHIDIKYKIHYDRLQTAVCRFARETINNYIADARLEEHLNSSKRASFKECYQEVSRSLDAKQQIANEIKGCIAFLASQACVDGALIFDPDLVSKGFGGVLKAKRMPRKIYISPKATATPGALIPVDPKHFGTRHRSMVAFCWENPGSLGLVVSQDGDIRAFYRIDDKLIMWENIKTQQFVNSKKLKRSA